jgi:hypothetical protein
MDKSFMVGDDLNLYILGVEPELFCALTNYSEQFPFGVKVSLLDGVKSS